MKIKNKLTTGETFLVLGVCVVITFLISFFVSWCLLHIWNWFINFAGFNLAISINWGTVIGLSAIIWVLKSIFGKKQ